MKKNDVFTFTAPNGVEVTAVVVSTIPIGAFVREHICYAQNRLFTMEEIDIKSQEELFTDISYKEVIVEYCILPEYDEALKSESIIYYLRYLIINY